MTSGIYQLTFANGDTYIGKSVDVERRWDQHWKDLENGKHAKPMMQAFYASSMKVDAKLLLEVHPDLLDEYEGLYINEWRPTLNTQIPARRSDEDYEILKRYANDDNAHISVPQLMRVTYDMKRSSDENVGELRALKDTWDDRVALEAAAIEGHEEALEKLEALEAELEEWKQRAVESLQFRVKLESLGWWGRLWKMW